MVFPLGFSSKNISNNIKPRLEVQKDGGSHKLENVTVPFGMAWSEAGSLKNRYPLVDLCFLMMHFLP